MGNRAVITFEGATGTNVGIYLHWNGGVESVLAFGEVARKMGARGPVSDPAYGMARLTQIISNYFGGTISIGIGPLHELDCNNGDNGLYYLNDQFCIVERRFCEPPECNVMHLVDLDEKRRSHYFGVLSSAMERNQSHFKEEG